MEMKPSDKKVLEELRKTTLAYLSKDEYAEIEKAVSRDGILKVTGTAKAVIADAVRKKGYDFNYKPKMEKADSVKSGDMVSWNSSGGGANGKVVRVISSGKINVPDSSFNIEGTEDDPAALIQLYRDGKPTNTKVGHKVSSLKKA